MSISTLPKKGGKTIPGILINLLLVDKDDITLLRHRRIAESSGFFKSIRSAVDGLHAFELINSANGEDAFSPDLVILDIDLPVLNGITLLKVLSKTRGDKKRIIYTALTSSMSVREYVAASALGVSHFLTKPLTDKKLRSLLREISAEIAKPQSQHTLTSI